MKKILLVTSLFVFFGCNSKSTEPETKALSIAAGTYENITNGKIEGENVAMKVQIEFRSDKTFSVSAYLNSIEAFQYKGNFALNAKGDSILYTSQTSREFDGTWSPWTSEPDDGEKIRSITATSFQTYQDSLQEFGISPQWITYSKL